MGECSYSSGRAPGVAARRRMACVIATLVAVGVLAGCGGGTSPTTTPDSVTGPTTAEPTGTPAASATPSSGPTSSGWSADPSGTAAPGLATPIPEDPGWELLPEPYLVWGVATDDVLNVRSGAGVGFPIVATLPPAARGVRVFADYLRVGSATWQPVEVPGGAGWVNVRYLRPEPAASPAVRGTPDPALDAAAAGVRDALQAGDWSRLAAMVHPTRGVTLSAYAYTDEDSPVLTADRIRNAAADDATVLWGYTDGEGAPIRATVRDRLREIAGTTALTSTTDIGFNTTIGRGNSLNNVSSWFAGDDVVEYHFSGTARWEGMDWDSVRFVFDTSSSPLLVGIVRDMWTI